MLVSSDFSTPHTSDPSSKLVVKELIQIWANRYKPKTRIYGRDLAIQMPIMSDTLAHVSSPAGRGETAEKLHRTLIKLNCEFADAQSRELHDYGPSTASANESKRIVQCTVEIYSTLIDFYQRSSTKAPQNSEANRDFLFAGFSVSDVMELTGSIEPLLLEYQNRHQISDDWSKLGFLTTHLNFSNAALLKNLTTVEQFFLEPYFKFVEEQVALPWERICAAASTHQYASPAFQLVRYMLPEAEGIAHRVYLDLLKAFPRTTLQRGRLDHPGVKHSCLRDLNMFQGYLWLCVMEGSLASVEDELVRTCTMVMPRIGVPWEMILKWNEILMAEIMDRTLLSHQSFLEPYMARFIQTFQQSKGQFSLES
ncbi:MAG: hypothetical protein AAFV90_15570 [Cyanobacteria bacterium J06634_5]